MSVGEVAAALREGLNALADARKGFEIAAAGFQEAATITEHVVSGTSDPDLARVPGIYTGVVDELRTAWVHIAEVERRIGAYLASLGTTGHPVADSNQSGPTESVEFAASRPPSRPAQPPAGVENKHGDRYPVAALPYCDDLPPRVRRGTGNVAIVGHVEIDGRDFGTLTAHRSDGWAQDAAQRAVALSQIEAADVAHHVEMKVVAVMVRNGARHGRVIINHAPCGSEGFPRGCDKYLPDFLPEDHTLIVLGTDSRGNPFEREYQGKAPS